MRRSNIGHIEGWILTHQDHIDPRQVELLELPKSVMMAVLPHDFEWSGAGVDPPVVQSQRVGQVMEQGMPASLRLEREGESRIRIDVDPIDRIHLDRNGEGHADLPVLVLFWIYPAAAVPRYPAVSAVKSGGESLAICPVSPRQSRGSSPAVACRPAPLRRAR